MKNEIDRIKAEKWCPFLRNFPLGHYCGKLFRGDISKISPENHFYPKSLDIGTIQLFCKGEYEKCAIE